MPSQNATDSTTRPHAGRVGVFDVVRGFSVVSMVAFHFCYDLKFITGIPLEWFAPPLQDIWRASISWTFLFVAGCMCALSRDNLKRGLVYSAFALAVFVVTTAAGVDTPISFGIIFCMAASTLLEWVLERIGCSPNGYVAAAALFAAFLLTLGVPRGHVGIGPLNVMLPQELYATDWFSWLGLPGPHFFSGDYYPLIPYTLMYLTGVAIGRTWHESGYPAWAYEVSFAPLSFVGRHALLIYALHQPILLVLASLF